MQTGQMRLGARQGGGWKTVRWWAGSAREAAQLWPALGHTVPITALAIIVDALLICSTLVCVELAGANQALDGVGAGPAGGG